MYHTRRRISFLALLSALLGSTFVAEGAELFPGRIRNPDGIQVFMDIAYNSVQDYYLLGYAGGGVAFVGRLSVDGVFSDEKVIKPAGTASSMQLSYNPVRNEFLYVWRNVNPTTIRARFLDGDGNPIGNEFAVGSGKEPHMDFDPVNQRYLVTWNERTDAVRYKVIDGDSTNPTPVLASGTIASNGVISDQVQFGEVDGRFLVVYVRLQSSGNIFGRLVTTGAGGVNLSKEFAVANSTTDEARPVMGYHSKENRWIVAYEFWPGGGTLPQARVALVAPNRTVTRRFNVAATGAWEIPSAVTYNSTTETVMFSWRHSGSVEDSRSREWEVSDGGASAVNPLIILSTDNAAVTAATARPHPVDPQVTVLWRINNGGDGVHAGIIHVDPPPPDLTAPAAVMDLAGETGGADLLIGGVIVDDVSSELGSQPATHSIDSNTGTFWGTVAVSSRQDEWIAWDLGTPKNVRSVTLWSRNKGDFFPLDYDVQVSLNGTDYTTVATVSGAVVPPGASTQHNFSPISAQFVRVFITMPRQTNTGYFKVQLAEAQITEAQNTPGMITAHWTAPGDDGNVGAAKTYHLKWSESAIDDGNFDSANDVLGLPLPQLAGNTETVTITGLPDETQVYIALKTEDENMNVSDISNLPPPVNTPGVPPAPVENLQVSPGGSPDEADLTWQATGDDGMVGNLPAGSSYDLRWATFPINDGNWASAQTVAGEPAPGPVGFVENFTVTGLPPEATVYFGIKVLDEVGNASPTDISPSEPMLTTPDFGFPDPITDLATVAGGGPPVDLAVSASDASSEQTDFRSKAMATDNDPASYWATLAADPRDEFITIDTGDIHNIVQVKLLARADNGTFFPEDVEIHVSDSPTSGFVNVGTFPGLPNTNGTLHGLDIPPTMGQYVKVLVTKARTNNKGKIRVHIAEIDVAESPIVPGVIRLQWTASGDNGQIGQASSYDLRWSELAINAANWDSPDVHPLIPPLPRPAGSPQMTTVTGLPDETMVYFAMTTSDEVPNESLISNVASALTAGVPPEPIDDLQVTGFTGTTADFLWTARADAGPLGKPSSYDMRYSTSPITANNFHLATPVTPAPPVPANPGQQQAHTVTGLDDGMTFYFAMKAVDAALNESPLNTNGNVMVATPDVTAPGRVTDLTATAGAPSISMVPAVAIDASSEASLSKRKELATDGDTATFFGTPASAPREEYITVDTQAVRVLAQVRLRSPDQTTFLPEDVEIQVSNSPMSGFVTVGTFTGLPGTTSTWHTLDFTDAAGRYLRVLATKARLTSKGTQKVHIAEIEVFDTAPASTLSLSFSSPGDDPGFGTPTFYDVRYSTSPILDDGDFNGATQITSEPTVNLASFGEMESFEIPAPQEGVTLHFAMKAGDEATPSNLSLLSNNESFVVPIVEPSAVSDLTVSRITSVSAELSFTATGDDGVVGVADSYTVKRSTSPIFDEGSFASATTVTTGVPAPQAPGTTQTIQVTGLSPSTTYYFAMKVNDEITSSGISNAPMATTDPPDTTPPAAITDLRGGPPTTLSLVNAPAVQASSEGLPKENSTDGDLTTDWRIVRTPVDGGEWITVDTLASRLIGRVRLRSPSGTTYFPENVEIQVSENNLDFTTVAQATGLPSTTSMWHAIDFTPVMGRYVRINLTKMRPAKLQFRAHIAEIEVYQAAFVAGDVTLAWTAPGDDGDVGQATEYDLRWSNVAGALEANFVGQPPLETGLPQPAGSVETTNPIMGLPSGALYFAIKTRDEVTGQFSAISNVLVVENP